MVEHSWLMLRDVGSIPTGLLGSPLIIMVGVLSLQLYSCLHCQVRSRRQLVCYSYASAIPRDAAGTSEDGCGRVHLEAEAAHVLGAEEYGRVTVGLEGGKISYGCGG